MRKLLFPIALTLACVLSLANSTQAQTLPPQGRLTLTSNTPVMTSDVTNATAVYYTPYIGNSVPIYASGSFSGNAFSQLTMTLNSSNHGSGNIYDLFVFNNSGTVTIGAGPAWSTSTSRGTGSGTTQLTQLQGIWVNANSFTLTNGATSYSSIAANVATYVGSVYITTSGETSVQFKPGSAAGGSNNVVGLWNAYNRIPISSLCADSNTAWTYASSTWEALDNNNSNRVTFLDGLGQSAVEGRVTTIAYNATNGNGADIGVNEDSTSNAPNVKAAYQSGSSVGFGAAGFAALENFGPAVGLHYLQAMQSSPNSTTSTIAFNGGQTYLLYRGEM